METLVEFVRFTKGWEYIIAIFAVLSFMLFWRLLTRELPIKAKKRVEERAAAPKESYQAGVPRTALSANYSLRDSPCWELKHCSESMKNACPAFLHPDVTCWQAKKVANGWKTVSK